MPGWLSSLRRPCFRRLYKTIPLRSFIVLGTKRLLQNKEAIRCLHIIVLGYWGREDIRLEGGA